MKKKIIFVLSLTTLAILECIARLITGKDVRVRLIPPALELYGVRGFVP
jgi:hypothetical protein